MFPWKLGQTYGNAFKSDFFTDTQIKGFDHSFALSGFVLYENSNNSCSYKFTYRSASRRTPLHSAFDPPPRKFPQIIRFDFDRDERIVGVRGYVFQEMVESTNPAREIGTIIHGLQFYSDKDIASFSPRCTNGTKFEESFPGYYIHYVQGYFDEYIRQIQFIWRSTDAL